MLDAEIGQGIANADAGMTVTAEVPFDPLERKYQDLTGNRA
ncbi:MAG TPA: hypothetical protein VF649_11745 [Sphingomonas sp.]|jgi:hypothetical protein